MVMEGMVWLVSWCFVSFFWVGGWIGDAWEGWKLAGLGNAIRDVVVVGGGLTRDGAAGTVTARAESGCFDAMENLVSTVLLWR